MKTLLPFRILSSAIALAASAAFSIPGAQAQTVAPCGTFEMVQKSLAEHPELRENLRRLEQETQAKMAAGAASRLAPGDPFRIIPVVFHVMHNYGPENISDAQVADCIRIMNLDYANRAADTNRISHAFRGIRGTTNFEFRLAKLDPNGNCTNGVTRHVTDLTYSAGENVKDIISWDTQKYLNIWVVSRIASGAGGYSYYPGSAPSQSHEGIVILASQAGSIGASGGSNLAIRSLTHEAGHFFNLPHTWGNSNTPGTATNCNIDDGVADTPNTVGVADQSCDTNFVSCGVRANVENYMDYASCGRMFTQGQSARMRIAAESNIAGRSNLWSQANLISTGVLNTGTTLCAPQVSFDLPQNTTCPGTSITVNPNISQAPTDSTLHLRWSFPGGQPATSTDFRPTVTYASEGRYPVKLVAYNSAGADSVTQNDAVFVSANNPAYLPGEAEDFEAAAFPQVGSNPYNIWTLEKSGNTPGWTANSIAAFQSARSLRILPSTLPTGVPISAISPRYDLTGASDQIYLQYKFASARRGSTNADVLKLYSSTTCGRNFVLRIQRQGINGAAAAYTSTQLFSGSFRPQAADWRTERISIRNLAGMSDVRFKFELTPNGGNNFFIDSLVVIDPLRVGVQGDLAQSLQISPVPATDQLEVRLPQAGAYLYHVTDALGRRLAEGSGRDAGFSLPTQQFATGTYLLFVSVGDKTFQRRFVVQQPSR